MYVRVRPSPVWFGGALCARCGCAEPVRWLCGRRGNRHRIAHDSSARRLGFPAQRCQTGCSVHTVCLTRSIVHFPLTSPVFETPGRAGAEAVLRFRALRPQAVPHRRAARDHGRACDGPCSPLAVASAKSGYGYGIRPYFKSRPPSSLRSRRPAGCRPGQVAGSGSDSWRFTRASSAEVQYEHGPGGHWHRAAHWQPPRTRAGDTASLRRTANRTQPAC